MSILDLKNPTGDVNQYADLIQKIEDFLRNKIGFFERKKFQYLRKITKDLKAISTDSNIKIYQHPVYQHPEACAYATPYYEYGTSEGECYGLTFAMLLPEYTPFLKDRQQIEPLHLNEQIYNFQKYQLNRKKDTQIIKRTRVTRRLFFSSNQKMANKIIEMGSKTDNHDKHFQISRHKGWTGHATYFSFRADGTIWYMDQNRGAFIFDNQEKFSTFYCSQPNSYQENKRILEICELHYDPDHTRNITLHSFAGFFSRTLLTGTKYYDGLALSIVFRLLFRAIIIASALTIAILFPQILTLGVIIGGGIALGVMALWVVLQTIAQTNALDGILAPVHLFKDLLTPVPKSLHSKNNQNFFGLNGVKSKVDSFEPPEHNQLEPQESIVIRND